MRLAICGVRVRRRLGIYCSIDCPLIREDKRERQRRAFLGKMRDGWIEWREREMEKQDLAREDY